MAFSVCIVHEKSKKYVVHANKNLSRSFHSWNPFIYSNHYVGCAEIKIDSVHLYFFFFILYQIYETWVPIIFLTILLLLLVKKITLIFDIYRYSQNKFLKLTRNYRESKSKYATHRLSLGAHQFEWFCLLINW